MSTAPSYEVRALLHEAEHFGEVRTTERTQVAIAALRKICLPESKLAIDEFIAENPSLKLCAQARAQAAALQQADARADREQQAANLALAVGGVTAPTEGSSPRLAIAFVAIIVTFVLAVMFAGSAHC